MDTNLNINLLEDALKGLNEENIENQDSNPAPITSDDNPNPGSSDNLPASNSDSPLYKFAEHLKEEGYFSEDDLKEYDGSIDGLVSITTKLADRLAEDKTKNYSPEALRYIKLLNEGLNIEEAKDIVQKVTKFESINEDVLENDIEIQKSIVKEYLSKTGLDEAEIEEQIEFLEDNGKLFSKSLNFHSKLKSEKEREEQTAIEKARLAKAQEEENNKKTLEAIKAKVQELDEFMPGIKLTQQMKDKVYKNITTPAKIENGVALSEVGLKRMKDPVQFEITLNILNELGVFDGKFDKLLNGGKNKTVEELERSIQHSDFFGKSNPPATQVDKTKEILDSISSIPTFKI